MTIVTLLLPGGERFILDEEDYTKYHPRNFHFLLLHYLFSSVLFYAPSHENVTYHWQPRQHWTGLWRSRCPAFSVSSMDNGKSCRCILSLKTGKSPWDDFLHHFPTVWTLFEFLKVYSSTFWRKVMHFLMQKFHIPWYILVEGREWIYRWAHSAKHILVIKAKMKIYKVYLQALECSNPETEWGEASGNFLLF